MPQFKLKIVGMMAAIAITVGIVSTPAPAQRFGQGSAELPTPKPVKYGMIVEGVFNQADQIHLYVVDVSPGDRVTVSIKPTGNTLATSLGFYDPTDRLIKLDPTSPVSGITSKKSKLFLRGPSKKRNPFIETPPLSGRGPHVIVVANGGQGGVGEYKLLVGAIRPDGEVIEAGGAAPSSSRNASAPGKAKEQPEVSAFGGTGFPGLPPVDFAEAVTLDLPADGVARGTISSPRDRTVRGFTIQGRANEPYEVTITRTRGSFPLGFVALSAGNDVLAQSSLVAADRFTTTLALPAGSTTLGIYRLDLGKAAGTGPTEFEVRARPASSGR